MAQYSSIKKEQIKADQDLRLIDIKKVLAEKRCDDLKKEIDVLKLRQTFLENEQPKMDTVSVSRIKKLNVDLALQQTHILKLEDDINEKQSTVNNEQRYLKYVELSKEHRYQDGVNKRAVDLLQSLGSYKTDMLAKHMSIYYYSLVFQPSCTTAFRIQECIFARTK